MAIFEDHPMTVFGLQKTFERTHDISATAVFSSEAGLPAEWDLDAAIVSIDREDPLPLVANLAPHTKVLVMSGNAGKPLIDACLGLGAIRHLDKRLPLTRFCDIVRMVVTGHEHSRSRYRPEPGQIVLSTLSPREREVLAYIADGFTHEQTARRIGISRHTVDTYVKRVRLKLDVGNKAELTRLALGGVLTASYG